jgi:hypothetical protein
MESIEGNLIMMKKNVNMTIGNWSVHILQTTLCFDNALESFTFSAHGVLTLSKAERNPSFKRACYMLYDLK